MSDMGDGWFKYFSGLMIGLVIFGVLLTVAAIVVIILVLRHYGIL